jgi:hypothetical protein
MFQQNTVKGCVPSNHSSSFQFDMYIIPEAHQKTQEIILHPDNFPV